MRRHALRAAAIALLLLTGISAPERTHATQTAAAFASQIDTLSERGGYFDTDNLISNERSYLDVIPELKRRGVRGGAYIGVGPDQNFSYIAAVRPDIAFIVDIRRDNLLLHLLFKALFELAGTRVEYLALLLGRPAPAGGDWKSASIDQVVAQVEVPPLDARAIAALRTRTDEAIARIGVALTPQDRATIDRFHRRFIDAGSRLQFQSAGRPPQSHYPEYRDLLLATTESGQKMNYLASEESYQFVKSLQARDLVIPVIGDLSGSRALAAIGELLARKKLRVSALYASNVEFYLYSDGRFEAFAANLGRLPRADHSVVIRSVFGRFGWPRGGSVSQVQDVGEILAGLAKGRYRYYEELVGGR
jgi:hypothetical protein